jgi:hypothetical protein
MARTAFIEKLKKRSDFTEIVGKIKTVQKPLQYVMDTFDLSYPAGKRLLTDLGISERKETPSVKAQLIIDSLDNRFGAGTNATVFTLIKFKEYLDEQKLPVLQEMLKLLTDRPSISTKAFICRAICYIIQERYYTLIMNKEMPQVVKERTEMFVNLCY